MAEKIVKRAHPKIAPFQNPYHYVASYTKSIKGCIKLIHPFGHTVPRGGSVQGETCLVLPLDGASRQCYHVVYWWEDHTWTNLQLCCHKTSTTG